MKGIMRRPEKLNIEDELMVEGLTKKGESPRKDKHKVIESALKEPRHAYGSLMSLGQFCELGTNLHQEG